MLGDGKARIKEVSNHVNTVDVNSATPANKVTVQVVVANRDIAVSKTSAQGPFSGDPPILVLEGSHGSVKMPDHHGDERYDALKKNLILKLAQKLNAFAVQWKTAVPAIEAKSAAYRIADQYIEQILLCQQACFITGGNKSLSEDLLHDVVIQFLDRQDVKRMHGESAARAYIVASARNRWRDYVRRENKNESLEAFDEPISSENNPIELLLLEERLASIEKILSEDERETFWRMVEGKDLKEIAKEESIKYSNAGVRVHRIRNKISNLLK